jgi:hypothetical protein
MSFRSGSEEVYLLFLVGFVERGAVVYPGIPGAGDREYTVEGDRVEFDFISTLTD